MDENTKTKIKDHNKEFYKQFGKLFLCVFVLTFILGLIDCSTGLFQFKDNDYYKDILIALIGFLGVLVGFIIAGLSIFISGLQNRLTSSTDNTFEIKLNSYWDYLISVTKLPILALTLTIFLFILLLTFRCSIEQSYIYVFALPFSVCLAGQMTYMAIDRLFDYFSNPF